MQPLGRAQPQETSGRLYDHAEHVITTSIALTSIASVYHIQRINEAVESDRNSAQISLTKRRSNVVHAPSAVRPQCGNSADQSEVQGSARVSRKGRSGARLISRREFGVGKHGVVLSGILVQATPVSGEFGWVSPR